MNDLLKEIMVHEQYLRRLDFEALPEYRDTELVYDHKMDEICEQFGKSFSREFRDLLANRSYITQLACFAHGFHVAVRLLLA